MEGEFIGLAHTILRVASEGGIKTDDVSGIAGQKIGGHYELLPW